MVDLSGRRACRPGWVLWVGSAMLAASLAGAAPDGATSPQLSDGEWELTVDRVLPLEGDRRFSGLPSAPMTDTDYTAVTDGRRVRIAIADQGKTVTIETESFGGRRIAAEAPEVVFELSEGTFAGGRFVVWAGEAGLEAELTVFGSGLPILSSERGSLRPVPPGR